MKARQVRDYFRANGTWVDWDRTCDQFLHGDPDVEVKGIAVGWILTLDLAHRAAKGGANLFITHEPIFYEGFWGEHPADGPLEKSRARKRRELDRLGLTVLRCHDTWDRFPGVGIPDAWARFLGFTDYRRDPISFYGKARIVPASVATLARRILQRTGPLGQKAVEVFQPRVRAGSVCVGTGAITDLAGMMEEHKADCYLLANDGSNAWSSEIYSADWNVPLIRVDHATAELPGMMALAEHLTETFPDVLVRYIPYPCPYHRINR